MREVRYQPVEDMIKEVNFMLNSDFMYVTNRQGVQLGNERLVNEYEARVDFSLLDNEKLVYPYHDS